ncbi:HAMP domain-containing sensor histidine kinase [Clostridiaceae bacterium M8S5]|nr:HAMP domain-containing sensor histidine kinase [Clostridiaceae bacterium M8S5]
MKRKSLFKKYIMWSLIIIFSLLLLLISITYKSIKDFFTDETYNTIEYAQNLRTDTIKKRLDANEDFHITDEIINQNFRAVGHIILVYDESKNEIRAFTNSLSSINKDVLKKNIIEINMNNYNKKRYVQTIQGKKLYYVIKKIDSKFVARKVFNLKKGILGQRDPARVSGYLLSYMWETYSNELTRNIFSQFIIVVFSFVIIILVTSYIMIKKISRRFKKLEVDVANIAQMKLDKPIVVEEDDEIGRLSRSIDKMRIQLKKHDEDLRNYFHSISHELKTPIMIIKGYTDSILCKKYPKGNLDSSLYVIDEEIDRLDTMVKNILYLNKIDFISKGYSSKDKVDVVKLIYNVSERFKNLDHSIKWQLDLPDFYTVRGQQEQWESILNNLLDNQVRYADKKIKISIVDENIQISNDGEHMSPRILEKLFNPFHKGEKGSTGLGLYIVKRLLNLNKYDIIARNEEVGVIFCIKDIS